jgi:ankyrin repeat protein
LAAAHGHLGVVKALLHHGAQADLQSNVEINVNNLNPGSTALTWAAQRGHAEIVALLLQHYTEVDRKCRRRDKALYLAAYNRHEEVMEILLKHPADVISESVIVESAG